MMSFPDANENLTAAPQVLKLVHGDPLPTTQQY